jgi:hypothetical protein
MLRRSLLAALIVTSLAALAGTAGAAPVIGQRAPDFRVAAASGKARTLHEFRGRIVVLEWTNAGCPYSGKHYNSGNMQSLQRAAKADGVVWLTVVSSGAGEQGYVTAPAARAWMSRVGSAATDLLLDADSALARTYEAKTTPHMFIVGRDGRLAYMGAIDDRPYYDPESLKGAHNYVAAALADLAAGRPVRDPVTRPYGCSVKYASAG